MVDGVSPLRTIELSPERELPAPPVAGRGGRRVALPSDPSPTEAVRLRFGLPADNPVDRELALASVSTEAFAHTGALLELACWRSRIADLPPGPKLLEALNSRPDELAAERHTVTATGAAPMMAPERSHAAAVVAGVVARRRQMAQLAAAEAQDLELLSRTYPGMDKFLPTELAQALSMREASAASLIEEACRLVRVLPLTWEALHSGEISTAAAAAINDATRTTSDDVAAKVECAILPTASGRTPESITRSCQRRVIKLDADGARSRHRKACGDRRITRWVLPDGMAAMQVTAAAQDIAVMYEAITALADAAKTPGDVRELGHRRVDVLADLCRDVLERGGWNTLRLPERQRSKPQIHVVMPLHTLLGGDGPCELVGQGWIAADQARLIAADAELRRLVCDPLSGTLLDYGRTVYRPPKHLADHVIARDRTCPIPGCQQPARRNQLDHVVPARPHPETGLPTLGSTSAENLATPCQHHHIGKDGRAFKLVRDADGSYRVTTYLGIHTRKPPQRLLDQPPYPGGGENGTEPPDSGLSREHSESAGDGLNPDHAKLDQNDLCESRLEQEEWDRGLRGRGTDPRDGIGKEHPDVLNSEEPGTDDLDR